MAGEARVRGTTAILPNTGIDQHLKVGHYSHFHVMLISVIPVIILQFIGISFQSATSLADTFQATLALTKHST
jgi:hypothetical protein